MSKATAEITCMIKSKILVVLINGDLQNSDQAVQHAFIPFASTAGCLTNWGVVIARLDTNLYCSSEYYTPDPISLRFHQGKALNFGYIQLSASRLSRSVM